jgi:hypothetical protein
MFIFYRLLCSSLRENAANEAIQTMKKKLDYRAAVGGSQ